MQSSSDACSLHSPDMNWSLSFRQQQNVWGYKMKYDCFVTDWWNMITLSPTVVIEFQPSNSFVYSMQQTVIIWRVENRCDYFDIFTNFIWRIYLKKWFHVPSCAELDEFNLLGLIFYLRTYWIFLLNGFISCKDFYYFLCSCCYIRGKEFLVLFYYLYYLISVILFWAI